MVINWWSTCRESWLHKQQQRLRAKKEQEDVTSYRTTLGSSSRPSRLNASKRFDGYTSDTGFADEVEYRTIYSRTPPPVRATYSEQHQQPGRNYHTISSTTTTKTYNNQNSAKERPFVAVKRAHEQSKRGYDVSSYIDRFCLWLWHKKLLLTILLYDHSPTPPICPR